MSKFDLYQEVTDRIITEIEKGNIPWNKPWVGGSNEAVNWLNQKPYSMINQFLLGGCGEWASYKQVQAAGGQVKKGAKAKIVVFWKMMSTEVKDTNGNVVRDDSGKVKVKLIPILRYYNVFSIENDVEGLDPKRGNGEFVPSDIEPDEQADSIIEDYITRSGVTLEYILQNRAYYSPASDKVVLPKREQFSDIAEFYSTAFHELTHSTGHPKRLNRIVTTANFGSCDYSKEELVAEIGAAGILNRIGIESEGSFRNSAAYIQGWLKALRNDKKMIITAASKAEKAIALILGENHDNSQIEE